MRDVMVNGRSVRPYMKTRMPQYGEPNIGRLIELFQSTDQLPETKFAMTKSAMFTDQKKMREQGLHLAGNKDSIASPATRINTKFLTRCPPSI